MARGAPRRAGATAASVNPADGQTIGRYAAAGSRCAWRDRRRQEGFERPDWAQAPRLRQQVMLHWADALERKSDELARLLTLENGKVLAQSRGEMAGAISEIRYYAGLARTYPGHVFEVGAGHVLHLIKEPAGVAGLIIPWNAPVVLLIRALTPALAAGCTVVIKPAPQSALITAAVIAELHAVLAALGDGVRGVVNLVSERAATKWPALVTSPGGRDQLHRQQCHRGAHHGSGRADDEEAVAGTRRQGGLPGVRRRRRGARGGQLAAAATIISGQQCTAARRAGARLEVRKR